VLRMIESGIALEDLTLADEMGAIRGISRDLGGTRTVELADGRALTAADVQERYLEQARTFARTRGEQSWYPHLFDLWQRAIDAVRSGDHSAVDTELDWAIKEKLYRQVMDRRPGIGWDSPEIRRLDLAYHDVTPGHALYPKLVAQGRAARLVTDTEVALHVDTPPTTTRATLRGRFVAAAAAAGRDFAVDWTTMKLAGPGQRPVVLLDPLTTQSEEAEALIASVRVG
jgi:proteasome accessory factor A